MPASSCIKTLTEIGCAFSYCFYTVLLTSYLKKRGQNVNNTVIQGFLRVFFKDHTAKASAILHTASRLWKQYTLLPKKWQESIGIFYIIIKALLAQKRQNLLCAGICLRQHCSTGLSENLISCKINDLLCHISITDTGF